MSTSMSTSSSSSWSNYARSAKEFVLSDSAHLSAASNLILCTAVSGSLVHGVVCAALAFTISKIANFLREDVLSAAFSIHKCNYKLTTSSIFAAGWLIRFGVLAPLSEIGLCWKVHLLGATAIAAALQILSGPNEFLPYDFVPFIP